jgi:hypothetical protein
VTVSTAPAATFEDQLQYLAGEVDHFETLQGSLLQVRDYVTNSKDAVAVRLPVVEALTRHICEVESFVRELKVQIGAMEVGR